MACYHMGKSNYKKAINVIYSFIMPCRYRQSAPVLRVRVRQPDGSVSNFIIFHSLYI